MWNTIVLNFSASNVQTNHFKTISQKFGKIVNSFARNHLVHVIWQFNTFCISALLIFILFVALIFNMCRKLICIIGIFINFFNSYFIFFCVLFLEFIIFLLSAVFFLWPFYCFCVFLSIFYMFHVCFLLILTIIIHRQVLLFFVFIMWDPECLQSNDNVSLNDLWLLFATFLFSSKFSLITEVTLS